MAEEEPMTLDLYLKHLTEVGNAATKEEGQTHLRNPFSCDCEVSILTEAGGTIYRSTSYGNMIKDGEFIATARNEWNTLLEINRKLLGALKQIEEYGCSKDHHTGCRSAKTAGEAIAECEALIKERE